MYTTAGARPFASCVPVDGGRRDRDCAVHDQDTATVVASCVPVDRGRRNHDCAGNDIDTAARSPLSRAAVGAVGAVLAAVEAVPAGALGAGASVVANAVGDVAGICYEATLRAIRANLVGKHLTVDERDCPSIDKNTAASPRPPLSRAAVGAVGAEFAAVEAGLAGSLGAGAAVVANAVGGNVAGVWDMATLSANHWIPPWIIASYVRVHLAAVKCNCA